MSNIFLEFKLNPFFGSLLVVFSISFDAQAQTRCEWIIENKISETDAPEIPISKAIESELIDLHIELSKSVPPQRALILKAYESKLQEIAEISQTSPQTVAQMIVRKAKPQIEKTRVEQAEESAAKEKEKQRVSRVQYECKQKVKFEGQPFAGHFDLQDHLLYVFGHHGGAGALKVIDLASSKLRLLASDKYYHFGGARFELSNGLKLKASQGSGEISLLDPKNKSTPIDSLKGFGGVSKGAPDLFRENSNYMVEGFTVDARKGIKVKKKGLLPRYYEIVELVGKDSPSQIEFSPDGKQIVIVAHDSAYFFEASSGKKINQIELGGDSRHKLFFENGDRAIFVCLREKTIKTFDSVTWKKISETKIDINYSEFAMTLIDKGTQLIAASGNFLKIYEISSGKLIGEIDVGGYVRNMSKSPDSSHLAVFLNDDVVILKTGP